MIMSVTKTMRGNGFFSFSTRLFYVCVGPTCYTELLDCNIYRLNCKLLYFMPL